MKGVWPPALSVPINSGQFSNTMNTTGKPHNTDSLGPTTLYSYFLVIGAEAETSFNSYPFSSSSVNRTFMITIPTPFIKLKAVGAITTLIIDHYGVFKLAIYTFQTKCGYN